MTMVRRMAVMAFAAVLAACGTPVIDGRDAEHARASIVKVRESLPETKAKPFDDSLKLVLAKAADVPTLSNPHVLAAINGKTGEQIIAAAAELRRQQEEEKLRQEAAAIKATLNDIRASDNAGAAKLALRTSTSDAAAPNSAETQAAAQQVLAALKINEMEQKSVLDSADDDVKARCSGWTTGSGPAYVDCVRVEMRGKRFVTGVTAPGVPQDVGLRIRANCATKYPDSYRFREACENSDAGAIVYVYNHPEAMKTLRPERQAELKMLMQTQ